MPKRRTDAPLGFAVGDIVEGVVNRITHYGAFLDLPDGKRGLVHISEIDDNYVRAVSDFLQERQNVRAKVLTVSNDGRKIDLSIKQAKGTDVVSPAGIPKPIKVKPLAAAQVPRERMDPATVSFEEKLQKFLKSSEEKLSDLRRNLEAKRGGGRSRT